MTPTEFLTEAVLQRYSRREIVKRSAALGFSLPVVSAILAACGGDDDDDNTGDDPTATTSEPETTGEPTATSSTTGSADQTVEDATEVEDESPTESDSTGSGSEASGNIVISLADEPLTFANWNSSVWATPVIRNVMEALTNRDPETNELVPELALSWERTDDVTWRFTLREGATFHNGEAFNAEVAAFGLNYTFNPDNGFNILVYMFSQITATAVDEFTLDVSTLEPDPILLARLYFAPIPSMQQIQEDPDSAGDHPIGTGPYTFVEWAQGQYVRMTANPDWWGHNGNDPYGQVTIKDVELQYRLESTVRAGQLQAGEIQITHFLSSEDCESVPICITTPSVETVILRPDVMHPVLGDVRVRQAIAQAINWQEVAEFIYPSAIAASQIYGPATFGYNDNLEPYPYDLDLARELVEEAQADGVPIEQTVTLVTRGTAPGDAEFVQYASEQLNQAGLNAEILIIEDAEFRPAVYGTEREDVPEERGWLVLLPHGNELMDASASFGRYFSCDSSGGSDSMYCNDTLDPGIHEASELEGDERAQAYRELAEGYYNEYAVYPVVHLSVNYGISQEVIWTPRLDSFILLKEISFA